jgi:hypothetical protein
MGLPNEAGPVLLVLMAAFGLYMVFEVWRWNAGNQAQLTAGQFRRRLAGGVLLLGDMLLWYLANPLMTGRPARERLLYLLAATLLVFLPLILAVQEAAFVLRQYARWRGDLAQRLGPEHRGEE